MKNKWFFLSNSCFPPFRHATEVITAVNCMSSHNLTCSVENLSSLLVYSLHFLPFLLTVDLTWFFFSISDCSLVSTQLFWELFLHDKIIFASCCFLAESLTIGTHTVPRGKRFACHDFQAPVIAKQGWGGWLVWEYIKKDTVKKQFLCPDGQESPEWAKKRWEAPPFQFRDFWRCCFWLGALLYYPRGEMLDVRTAEAHSWLAALWLQCVRIAWGWAWCPHSHQSLSTELWVGQVL